MTYQEWIAERTMRGDFKETYGKCKEISAEMCAAFPGFRQARGYVWTTWGKRGHWWCVAPDGCVVDPTEAQFPGGVMSYEELKIGDEVLIGKCMNCGDEIWVACESLTDEPHNPHAPFCGADCYADYAAYCEEDRKQA